jgi:CheY-like chemotaxis protein
VTRVSDARRILVVEDDPLVAALIAELLEGAQYQIDGPYATLGDGMAALAAHFPAGAVVDVSLQDADAGLLADDLQSYDIPYLFCSGSTAHPVMRAHPTAPVISKPFGFRRLIPVLNGLLH